MDQLFVIQYNNNFIVYNSCSNCRERALEVTGNQGVEPAMEW